MLIDPHADDTNTLRIIGIDPGSVTMGVGLLEIDLRTNEILSFTAKTFNAKKMALSETDVAVYSERHARIFALTDALYDMFNQVRPQLVACESPFMSRRQPSAYGALMETVYAVRVALRKYDCTIPLDLVDPPTAKIAAGAKGNSGKEEVLAGIIKKTDGGLLFNEEKAGMPLTKIDEHSSDGLAIAMWRFNLFKEKLM